MILHAGYLILLGNLLRIVLCNVRKLVLEALWNHHNRRFFGCGRFKEPPTTGSVPSRQTGLPVRYIRLTGM